MLLLLILIVDLIVDLLRSIGDWGAQMILSEFAYQSICFESTGANLSFRTSRAISRHVTSSV